MCLDSLLAVKSDVMRFATNTQPARHPNFLPHNMCYRTDRDSGRLYVDNLRLPGVTASL